MYILKYARDLTRGDRFRLRSDGDGTPLADVTDKARETKVKCSQCHCPTIPKIFVPTSFGHATLDLHEAVVVLAPEEQEPEQLDI
jgi:hypothetical protein